MTISTDKNSFDEQIQKPCIVDFYTTGCPICEKLAPVFEQASENGGEIAFYKVNLDDDITLAERYGISHVPTLMVFDAGEMQRTHTGFLDDAALTAFIRGEEAPA